MSAAHGGSDLSDSGIDSRPSQANRATSQNRSCLLHSSDSHTLSFLLLSASAAIIWSMLNFPAGIRGLTLISFPAKLCTSLAFRPPPFTAALMASTILLFFFAGSAQVQLSVSYSIPKTTPFLQGPKVLSWSSRGASFTPSRSATALKQLSNSSNDSLLLAAAQMSSRC